jgi:integrase
LRQAEAEGECPQLVDAVWITALSGCRRGEVINLKWSEIDAGGSAMRLDESKEGESVRPAAPDCSNGLQASRGPRIAIRYWYLPVLAKSSAGCRMAGCAWRVREAVEREPGVKAPALLAA